MARPKDEAQQVAYRAGFVALIGRPNVGKSTLMNALLGQKVSIVTPKPQTTRTRIQGILTLPHAQLVFVDTPGFCPPRGPLHKAMRQIASEAAADADVSLVVAEVRHDAKREPGEATLGAEDLEVLQAARKGTGKVVVALNKVDALPRKEELLPWMAAFAAQVEGVAVVPISARKQDGLDTLVESLVALLPESPALFPEDMVTDQAERVLCAELVREQLLLQTQQEVPHSAAVVIESFEDGRDEKGQGLCRLEGRIYVERESQKAIVVGKGGHQIKAVSQAARVQIEKLLGCKVFLRLTVHVDPDWTESEAAVRRRMDNLPDFG